MNLRASFVLIIYLSWIGQSLSHSGHNDNNDQCKVIDKRSNYKLYWSIVNNELHTTVEVKTKSWIALGFTNESSLNIKKSNIFFGWTDDDHCSNGCMQAYKRSTRSSTASPLQELELVDGKFDDTTGITRLKFKSSLKTKDDRVISLSELSTFVWAVGADDIPKKQGDKINFDKRHSSGATKVNLTHSSPQCEENLVNSFESPSGDFNSQWEISEHENKITFTVRGKSSGWVAIGISSTPSMPHSDFVLGWIDKNGTSLISDRYATENDIPKLDTELGGQENIMDVNGSRDNDWITIQFSRHLDTTDIYDTPIVNKDQYLLWAYGNVSEDGQIEKHTRMGYVQLNLFGDNVVWEDNGITLIRAHAIIMIIVWCAFVPLGIFIARYSKIQLPKWFVHHVWIQVAGLILMTIGFILILVEHGGKLHVGFHQILGVITFILGWIQGGLGLLSHLKFQPTRVRPPVWPDKIHWWFGRGVFFVALVTMFFGSNYLKGTISVTAILILWMMLFVAALVFLESILGQTHEYSKLDETPDRKGISKKNRRILFAIGVTMLLLLVWLCATINSAEEVE